MPLQECGLNLNHSQKELQPHGTSEFPCAGYMSKHTDRPEDIIPWHWHTELEIIMATEGVMELKVPGASYILHENDIAIINGKILHSAAGKPSCALKSFVFSPLLIAGSNDQVFYNKYLYPLLSRPSFSCELVKDKDAAGIAFHSAFEALLKDEFGYEFTVRSGISEVFLCLLKQMEKDLVVLDKRLYVDNERMEQMLEFIHSHYPQKTVLEDIAAVAGIGTRECLRCFKRNIGVSPIQYLLEYRLMQSAKMLAEEKHMNISQISAACGFDDSGYFSRQFARFYKCSPSRYRKMEKA